MCVAKNDKIFLNLVDTGILEVTIQGNAYLNGKRCGFKNAFGYHRIQLVVDGVRVSTVVHRLNYLVNVGPIPAGYVIDHIDSNPGNNHIDNLEAISNSENLRRAHTKKIYTRLIPEERNAVLELYEMGIRRSALIEMFDTSDKTIGRICKNSKIRHPYNAPSIDSGAYVY